MTLECECPRCGNLLDEDPEMNAVSRRDNKTYICSYCGRLEATEDICDLQDLGDFPKFCYSDDYCSPPRTVMIIKGASGYFKTAGTVRWTDHRILNHRLGIDYATADEMRSKSIFGWVCPDRYDRDFEDFEEEAVQ